MAILMDDEYYGYEEDALASAEDSTTDTWATATKKQPVKKGISYAAMLASMRMCEVNGKLQLVPANSDLVDTRGNWKVNPYTGKPTGGVVQSPYWSNPRQPAQQQQQQQQWAPQQQQQQWAPQQQQQQPRLTQQQQKQLIVQQYLRKQEARKNLAEVKSGKMFSNGHIQGQPPAMPGKPPQMMRQFMFK